jgi:Na+-transporting NADH:ubiquinone oxidoreductase subunit F
VRMYTVDINGQKQIEVEDGQSLYNGLAANDIFIPSACGGRAICGFCKVKVTMGGGEVLASELPFLSETELKGNVRLSCQVNVCSDISIEIPDALLSGRQYKCRCTEIEQLTADIKRFRFELIRPKAINYLPGQFIHLLIPVYFDGGEEVYRAYSIASNPTDKNVIELMIRRVPNGISTTYCFDHLNIGDAVRLNGPCGDFHLSGSESQIIFIAGGSGMAPIRCILNQMRNSGSKRKATYYFGVNKVSELFMLDEMKQFEKDLEAFRFVPVVASPDPVDNWKGATGLVTEAVERDIEDARHCEAYLCGSPGMVAASGMVLGRLGVADDNIYYDSFA